MDLLATYISEADEDAGAEAPPHLAAKCDALLSGDMNKGEARTRLMIAYHLIRQNPGAVEPQIVAATLLQRAGASHHMTQTWEALHARFPGNKEILSNLLGWMAEDDRHYEALELIDAYFGTQELGLAELTVKAGFYDTLQDYSRSDALFRELIERNGSNPLPRVIFGKSLFARGAIHEAFTVLDPVRRQTQSPEAKRIIKATDRAIIAMETISPRSSLGRLTASLALRNTLSLFSEREPRPVHASEYSQISIAAGTLGARSSDRRLLRLASLLREDGVNLPEGRFEGAVELLCESQSETPNWQGFRSAFEAKGLEIRQLDDFSAEPLSDPPTYAVLVDDLFTLLPRATKRGVERLLAHLRAKKPELLVISSEEAILPFTLAALLAEIPRIIINLRAEAPQTTAAEDQPHYKALYHTLLSIPGITFATSNQQSAQSYARWLEAPAQAFTVLPDVVFPQPETLSRDQALLWQSFEIATPDAELTLTTHVESVDTAGGKPWSALFGEALARHPGLRIIALCASTSYQSLREEVAESGLGPRLLVVEDDDETARWLTHSQIFATTESSDRAAYRIAQAQMQGLPVIIDACRRNRGLIEESVTGFSVTASDEGETFIDALDRIIDSAPRRKLMGTRARDFAKRSFGPEPVLAALLHEPEGPAASQTHKLIQTESLPEIAQPPQNRPLLREGAVTEAYRVIAKEPGSTRNSA